MATPSSLTLYALPLLIAALASPARAQEVHEIRIEANRKQESYRFSPARVTVRPGDVLLFKAASGAPHNVVFEARGLSARARAALNAALVRRTADLSGPMLTQDGAEYRVVVPNLPAGTYGYFCLPHRAYDERGQLDVKR